MNENLFPQVSSGQPVSEGASSRLKLMPDPHDMVLGGFFGMLALVLPLLFHLVGLGRVFLPMFLPILALGFLVRWRVAAQVGAVVPIISALLMGMPLLYPPIAIIMSVEGAALGGVASFCYRSLGWGLWPSMLLALACQRVVLVLLWLLFSQVFHLLTSVVVTAVLVTGLPGLALQLIAVPLMVYKLERRYPTLAREKRDGRA